MNPYSPYQGPEINPRPTRRERVYTILLILGIASGLFLILLPLIGNLTVGYATLVWSCLCWGLPGLALVPLVIWIDNARAKEKSSRRIGWLAPLTMLLILGAPCASIGIMVSTLDLGFSLRKAEYEQVIALIKAGELDVPPPAKSDECSNIPLPAEFKHLSLTGNVCVKRNDNDLTASFFIENGILWAKLYVYTSGVPWEECPGPLIAGTEHWRTCILN